MHLRENETEDDNLYYFNDPINFDQNLMVLDINENFYSVNLFNIKQ